LIYMAKDSHEKYEEFHTSVYEGEGVFDRKTAHLICLAAALGAGCEFCIRYAISVLKKSGATKEEIDEVAAIAMTVGASKIKSEAMEAEEAIEENPDMECPICGISETGENICGGD